MSQLSWIPLKPDHCLKSKAQNDRMGCELIVVATHFSINIITLVVKVVTHTECIPAKNPVDGEHGTSSRSKDKATEERTQGKTKSVSGTRLHMQVERIV